MFCWLASTPTIIQLGCQARFNISTDSSLWRDPAGNAIAFNNCSHLQQHHPATAAFPAIQTPFKINLSRKNIISCKMNHRALFLFLAPVAPPPSNNLFKLPNSEQWSNLLPLRGPVNSDFILEKEKKKFIYLTVSWQIRDSFETSPRLRANERGSLKFASFEYSVQNIIWLRGVSRYFHEHKAPIGQHMSPLTLKQTLTPFHGCRDKGTSPDVTDSSVNSAPSEAFVASVRISPPLNHLPISCTNELFF